jgi:hypothetical protein
VTTIAPRVADRSRTRTLARAAAAACVGWLLLSSLPISVSPVRAEAAREARTVVARVAPPRAGERAIESPASPAELDRLTRSGVPERPLRHALAALACARARGVVDASTLTLIDYSRPSKARRLWVVDVAAGRVLFHEHVAHGRNSGESDASRFSNEVGSRQSSLGLFRTAETYQGRHGYSLRLDGLEPGINDRARERAIVMHGADYVTEEVASYFGRVGRSWGCPAIDPEVNRALIDTIRGGTALFAYYPDAGWLAGSDYLTCETETAAR